MSSPSTSPPSSPTATTVAASARDGADKPSDRVLRGLSKLREARSMSIRGSLVDFISPPGSPKAEAQQTPRTAHGENAVQYENPFRGRRRRRKSSAGPGESMGGDGEGQVGKGGAGAGVGGESGSEAEEGEEGGEGPLGDSRDSLGAVTDQLLEEQLGELADQYEALQHLLGNGLAKSVHELSRLSNHVARLHRELDRLQYVDPVPFQDVEGNATSSCGIEGVINASTVVVPEDLHTSCLRLGRRCDDLRSELAHLGAELSARREGWICGSGSSGEEEKGEGGDGGGDGDGAEQKTHKDEVLWQPKRFVGRQPVLHLWRAGQHGLSVRFSLQPSVQPRTHLMPNVGARQRQAAIRYGGQLGPADGKAVALLDMIEVAVPSRLQPRPGARLSTRPREPHAKSSVGFGSDRTRDAAHAHAVGECEEHLEAVRARLLQIEQRLRDLELQRQAEAEEHLRDSARANEPELHDPFAGHFGIESGDPSASAVAARR